MSYDCACAMMIGLLARNGDVLCVPKLVRAGPRTSAVNKTLPAAAAEAPAAIEPVRGAGRCCLLTGQADRQTDGWTDGHPTVTWTLYRMLCRRRQKGKHQTDGGNSVNLIRFSQFFHSQILQ